MSTGRLSKVEWAGVGVACVALATAALLAEVIRPNTRLTATASAWKDDAKTVARVIDGRTLSSWFLPNGGPGWIEVAFPEPRSLTKIQIINGRDDPFLQNAAKLVRITAYAGDTPSGAVDVTLNKSSNVQEVDLRARNVTRVRFQIQSHYGQRGGLAELRFE